MGCSRLPLASLAVVLLAHFVASLPESDTVVPEASWQDAAPAPRGQQGDALKARLALWAKVGPDLAQHDKQMHKMLKRELKDPASTHWARFLRHKGLATARKPGQRWTSHKGEVMVGSLLETSQEQAAQEAQAKGEGLCDKTVKQHHGYFNVDKLDRTAKGGKKNYFYWLFEAKDDPENAPTVLWLTGGPGCSSMLALMSENGPCTVAKGGDKTIPNPSSWNKKANIVFVDQPAGTGFSYGDHNSADSSEAEVSRDLYHFVLELMQSHPKYHKNDFYIFGESYAGHFVPAAAQAVFEGNKKKNTEYIPLRGIGIGNGLTDPKIPYKYYPEMARHPGNGAEPVVDEETYNEMKQAVPICTQAIGNCEKADKEDSQQVCAAAMSNCNAALIMPGQETGRNQYDMRIPCENPPLCYDFSDVKTYLNSPRVQKVLGVKRKWRSCNFGVNSDFSGDWMRNYEKHIPSMLENGHSVLIYAGDMDYICNWKGNKAWTKAMKWKGQRQYLAAKDVDWNVGSDVAGKVRHHGGLAFVQVHKAGHMVPMDQPKVALAMLDQFLIHKTLLVSSEEDREASQL